MVALSRGACRKKTLASRNTLEEAQTSFAIATERASDAFIYRLSERNAEPPLHQRRMENSDNILPMLTTWIRHLASKEANVVPCPLSAKTPVWQQHSSSSRQGWFCFLFLRRELYILCMHGERASPNSVYNSSTISQGLLGGTGRVHT